MNLPKTSISGGLAVCSISSTEILVFGVENQYEYNALSIVSVFDTESNTLVQNPKDHKITSFIGARV